MPYQPKLLLIKYGDALLVLNTQNSCLFCEYNLNQKDKVQSLGSTGVN